MESSLQGMPDQKLCGLIYAYYDHFAAWYRKKFSDSLVGPKPEPLFRTNGSKLRCDSPK
jgi:hypothetical protein